MEYVQVFYLFLYFFNLYFFNLRRDFIGSLFLLLNNSTIKFSLIDNKSSKLFFLYTTLEWFLPSIILFRLNSFFYNTFFVELVGIDSTTFNKKKNFITYIYIYYMYFYNVKFFFSYSAYYFSNVPSISMFYQNAQWPERELAEMFGVFFYNKLDNRRLLLDYSFTGHPLLKNYPCIGFTELIYSFLISWITLVPTQVFNFIIPDNYTYV